MDQGISSDVIDLVARDIPGTAPCGWYVADVAVCYTELEIPFLTVFNEDITRNLLPNSSTASSHSSRIQTIWGFLSGPRAAMLHFCITVKPLSYDAP